MEKPTEEQLLRTNRQASECIMTTQFKYLLDLDLEYYKTIPFELALRCAFMQGARIMDGIVQDIYDDLLKGAITGAAAFTILRRMVAEVSEVLDVACPDTPSSNQPLRSDNEHTKPTHTAPE